MPVLDASFGQYFFDLVLYLFLCFLSWKSINKSKPIIITWLLIVLFCVLSYFAGDWFHYQLSLPFIDKDYSEPIYYYFAILTRRNYLLYRFVVWGLATSFVYLTCIRLGLSKNITAFVLIWFFLPTFCYARASLAMASYFLGMSYIWGPSKQSRRLSSFCIGIVLLFLSILFHRSFLPIVAATPLVLVKYNRKTIVLLILLFPLIIRVLRLILSQMATEVVIEGEDLEAFTEAAQGYANQERRDYNWKYTLVSSIKYVGFYIPFFYMIWRTKIARKRICLPRGLEKMLAMGLIIFVVSLAFFVLSYVDNTSQVMGYRFLYMTGIPSTLLIAYALQIEAITTKQSLFLVFLSWFSTIALIVGKLFALA